MNDNHKCRRNKNIIKSVSEEGEVRFAVSSELIEYSSRTDELGSSASLSWNGLRALHSRGKPGLPE